MGIISRCTGRPARSASPMVTTRRTGSFFEPSQAIWLRRCLMPDCETARARRRCSARHRVPAPRRDWARDPRHEQLDELSQLLVAHRIRDGLVPAKQT
jgi:hypothetical protein